MNSGIKPDEQAIEQFNDLKLNRKHAYMVCTLNDKVDGLVVEKMGDKGAPYQELVDLLPKDDCRYAICDFEYETNENPPRKTNKLIMFLWVPISTKVQRKFAFASSNDALKKGFTGIQKEIQVNIIY
ncbi:hypothetical protein GW835_04530 [archaeon]|nr:hypothetical protein [archaeon]